MEILNVIVLRSFMFGDAKMMVDVFSREYGRLSCVCKIGSSKAGCGWRQMFQPLSLLELSVERKRVGQLPVVKDVHISVPFSNIPFNAYKLSVSMFLAEFLGCVTYSEHDFPLFYDYVRESILWLDGARSNFSNFHLVFMMRLTRFVGFYPNLDDYEDGCCFDMQNGCFVPCAASCRDFLDAEESRKMHLLMRMNYSTMHLFTMSRSERNRCLDVIIEFYRLHIPGFKELKSLDVLRELFV